MPSLASARTPSVFRSYFPGFILLKRVSPSSRSAQGAAKMPWDSRPPKRTLPVPPPAAAKRPKVRQRQDGMFTRTKIASALERLGRKSFIPGVGWKDRLLKCAATRARFRNRSNVHVRVERWRLDAVSWQRFPVDPPPRSGRANLTLRPDLFDYHSAETLACPMSSVTWQCCVKYQGAPQKRTGRTRAASHRLQ